MRHQHQEILDINAFDEATNNRSRRSQPVAAIVVTSFMEELLQSNVYTGLRSLR
jgi:hypothetical protein